MITDGVWRPTKIQEEFLKLPFSIFEAMFGGAAGGGKSELLLFIPIVYNFFQNPRFHGCVFRRTFPQLEASLIPRSAEIYRPFGAEYNTQHHLWTFPSGARVRLSHMARIEDARQHDTNEYQYLGFDELTAFAEFQYLFLLSRVRSTDQKLPAIVRSATNPGNEGHTWVKKRFVTPSPFGRKIIFDKITNTKKIFIPARLTDNPHLMEADPDYINRLRNLPLAEQKAKIDGDWDAFAGQAFDEFRDIKYPDEPENAMHVIPPFEIPLWWPRIIGIDWGYNAHTWAGWFAVAPNSRVFLYKEYFQRQRKIVEWGAEIARMSHGENIVHVALDPSAWQDRGDPHNIALQFAEASGFTPYAADRDRVSGRMLIHEYLRWKQKPQRQIPAGGYRPDLANQILRTRGINSFEEYRNLFVPEPEETNLPKLQIFNTCPAIISTIKSMANDDEKNVNDVKTFDGDDPYDGFRYGLKAVDFYTSELLEETNVRAKLGKIINKFETSGDQTTFYRQMEKFELENKVVPIRLYHRNKNVQRLRSAS